MLYAARVEIQRRYAGLRSALVVSRNENRKLLEANRLSARIILEGDHKRAVDELNAKCEADKVGLKMRELAEIAGG